MIVALLGLDVTPALVVLGAISGMTYGVLAVGLVLVHRSSKVINFAHGEIGAFGAAVCGVLVVRSGFPYWVAFVVGVALSIAIGAFTEITVIRRLRPAPRLMSLVATLGVAQFLLFFSSVVNSQVTAGSAFPQPPGMPEFRVGALLVTQSYSAMLIITPVVVGALAVFLRWSRFGLALRAASANTDRARMAGISAARMATMAWAMAGGVAAFTTVLIIPTRGFITAETLGPVLLLRALAPAVIARMASLPVALAAGIGIGIVDQVLIFNYPTSGVAEIILLGIIVVALLLQARRGSRVEEKQDWAVLRPWPILPEAFRQVWAIRNLGRLAAAGALVAAVGFGTASTNSTAVTLVAIVAFSLMGLSIGVVTGLGGQLALGQFALAGIGAVASFAVTSRLGPGGFPLALVCAAVAAGAVAVLVGVPALRVRGLMLGVVTLSFALAAQRWLLAQSWALGAGVSTRRPSIGGFSFDDTKRYYFWALGVLALGVWCARNVWHGGIGLRLRAVRDNEDAARALGVSATATKLVGFAIAGVLAGLAGSVYGHLLSPISAGSFDVVTSINIVALTVLGGIGLLAGPLLGAIYIIGLPRFLPLDSAGLAATALGWLLLILYFPGGIAQLVAAPRRHLIHLLARRAGLDPVAIEASTDGDSQPNAISSRGAVLDRGRPVAVSDEVLLEARAVVKRYGGINAVDGVDLRLCRGEILGLIGPNGAGKTTLFEVLSGFASADRGQVVYLGADVTSWSTEQRARAGLIRSFQDAALFPTLTVLETVTLAFERARPTPVVASAMGLHAAERRKERAARELVSLMGLDPFRNKQVRELSTGTRRITELACVVALDPIVLLLDEPSSGIAQRESEALGGLILALRNHLGCTLVVIEHDIPLLMGLSTRMVAMDTGQIIAQGSPDEVRSHPLVVTSYLGGDIAAIERSGAAPTTGAADRCRAVTRAGQRCARRADASGFCEAHHAFAEAT
jgi:ABC-type branched-subunit amino acid transport system ATPase component/ABC-type branched-subunit amino acid transport system permease subunit